MYLRTPKCKQTWDVRTYCRRINILIILIIMQLRFEAEIFFKKMQKNQKICNI